MTPLTASPSAHALAWTLLHFVWQGSAIGLLALACVRGSRLSAHARYRIGVVALGAMMLAPLATFGALVARPTPAADTIAIAASASVAEGVAGRADTSDRPPTVSSSPGITAFSPITVAVLLSVWGVGVLIFSARLVGGWIVARRWTRRAVAPVSAEIEAMVERIAARLALNRVARVYESAAAGVPMVAGWLRPVILVPAAVMGGLAPAQLEALIAHELAHVRRHDYLVNLLQSVVETLLFYHPAVWWVSREVREAREHCCDDLAIAACGDRLAYASALTELATMMKPRLALAATDGSLTARVRRILGEPHDRHRRYAFWAPVLLTFLVGVAFVPMGASSRATGGNPMLVAPAESQASAADRAKQEVAAQVDRPKEESAAKMELPKLLDEKIRQQARDQELLKAEMAEHELVRRTERARQSEIAALEARQMLDEHLLQRRLTETAAAAQQSAGERAQSRLDVEMRRLAELIEAVQQSQPEMPPAGNDVDGPLRLRQKIVEYEAARVESLRRRLSDTHPDVIAALRELKDREDQLAVALKSRDAARETFAIVYIPASEELRPGNVIAVDLRSDAGRFSIPAVTIPQDGHVNLPLFGLVKVGGLKLQEVEDLLFKRATPGGVGDKPLRSVSVTLVRRAN